MNSVLAIEKNVESFEHEAAEWAKHGVAAVRAETMHEAILRLARGEEYLFVGIIEDDSPDFTSQLRTMRDIAGVPIFIMAPSYTAEKRVKAINCGADSYDPLCASEYSVPAALEMLKIHGGRRAQKQNKAPQILTGGDVILSPQRRSVHVKNKEINLTRKEFGVLQCLMSNGGNVVSHTQLLHKVWGDNHGENDVDVLWRTVDRLRGKLAKASDADYIKIKRGVGYVFNV